KAPDQRPPRDPEYPRGFRLVASASIEGFDDPTALEVLDLAEEVGRAFVCRSPSRALQGRRHQRRLGRHRGGPEFLSDLARRGLFLAVVFPHATRRREAGWRGGRLGCVQAMRTRGRARIERRTHLLDREVLEGD